MDLFSDLPKALFVLFVKNDFTCYLQQKGLEGKLKQWVISLDNDLDC